MQEHAPWANNLPTLLTVKLNFLVHVYLAEWFLCLQHYCLGILRCWRNWSYMLEFNCIYWCCWCWLFSSWRVKRTLLLMVLFLLYHWHIVHLSEWQLLWFVHFRGIVTSVEELYQWSLVLRWIEITRMLRLERIESLFLSLVCDLCWYRRFIVGCASLPSKTMDRRVSCHTRYILP